MKQILLIFTKQYEANSQTCRHDQSNRFGAKTTAEQELIVHYVDR